MTLTTHDKTVARGRTASVATDGTVRARHLRAIWPNGIPDGQWLGISTCAKGRRDERFKSEWYATVEDACAVLIPSDLNVYVGLALIADDPESSRRATNKTVVAIPGFVADLDVKTEAFKSLEDALTFLNEFPVVPTLVISSGHGIQPWWLFEEPEHLDRNDQREHIARISRAFGQFIDDRAKAIGVTVDRVSDLARTMRLAGSVNVKNPLDPRPVEIMCDDGPRLPGPEWLADELGLGPLEIPKVDVGPVPNHLIGFSIQRCRTLDIRRLESHLEPGERLFNIWQVQGHYSHGDQSVLDLALFRELYRLGYEIYDAQPVLAELRKHLGEDVWKASRPDYVLRTWIKAKSLGPPKSIASPVLAYARNQAREAAFKLLPTILSIEGGEHVHHSTLAVMASHMDKSGQCFMAQRWLGPLIDRHPATANRILNWLRLNGFIDLIERGRGEKASTWSLTFASDMRQKLPS